MLERMDFIAALAELESMTLVTFVAAAAAIVVSFCLHSERRLASWPEKCYVARSP